MTADRDLARALARLGYAIVSSAGTWDQVRTMVDDAETAHKSHQRAMMQARLQEAPGSKEEPASG